MLSNSNSLANALGKLRFLAKPQKSSSNKLAKSLGKNPRLANSPPTSAYMRASVDLANRGFGPVACSPAHANCETFFPRPSNEYRSRKYISRPIGSVPSRIGRVPSRLPDAYLKFDKAGIRC